MLLYHGTTGRIADTARVEGLKPREANSSNWPNKPGREDCVYLTTVYAVAYATTAHKNAHGSSTDELAVIEIETDQLAKEALLPDEDFLDQCVSMKDSATRLTPHELKKKKAAHHRRIRKIAADLPSFAGIDWYRSLRKEFGELFEWVRMLQQSRQMRGWEASVEGMGTCAFQSVVKPSAITRIVYWFPIHHPILALFDNAAPAIDVYHHQHKELFAKATQWLFDGSKEGMWPDHMEYRNRGHIRLVRDAELRLGYE